MPHLATTIAISVLWLLSSTCTDAFMYRPRTGSTWDPSCMTWGGKTYCYFMYMCGSSTPGCGGKNESHFGHGLVAVSQDGVHFEEHSAFNAENGAADWNKPMIHKLADVGGKPQFVMNHGAQRVEGPDDPKVLLPDDRGCPAGSTQCLRWLKSNDALRWEYMYTQHPDPRWYAHRSVAGFTNVTTGRWDHAYMQEDAQRGGYVAFPVATPAPPHANAPGLLRSRDGLNWTVHAPVNVAWGAAGVQPWPGWGPRPGQGSMEIGGVEKMGSRFYMIGGWHAYGSAYSMFTLRSDGGDVSGPYAPDAAAFRLSGQAYKETSHLGAFGQGLAAWSRNYDTYPADGSRLISQYMCQAHDTVVWLLPFRKPVLDAAGHLRLAHWSGNDRLRGEQLQLSNTAVTARAASTDLNAAFIDGSETWDHLQGVVLTGTLAVPAGAASFGVVVNSSSSSRSSNNVSLFANLSLTAMLMDVTPAGNSTRVWTMPPSGWPSSGGMTEQWLMDTSGPFECGTKSKPKTCGVATTVSAQPGRLPFLLYLRHGTLELYVQPGSSNSSSNSEELLLLVQTASYGKYPQARGAIGFVVQGAAEGGGAELKVSDLQAWAMNLKRLD
jgi:hypothetical protein